MRQCDKEFSLVSPIGIGPRGLQGPQGPRGPQGPQGPQGEQGPQGDGLSNCLRLDHVLVTVPIDAEHSIPPCSSIAGIVREELRDFTPVGYSPVGIIGSMVLEGLSETTKLCIGNSILGGSSSASFDYEIRYTLVNYSQSAVSGNLVIWFEVLFALDDAVNRDWS